MHTSQHHQPHALRAAMAQALIRVWPGARQLLSVEIAQPEQVQPALPGLEVSESTWAEWEAAAAERLH